MRQDDVRGQQRREVLGRGGKVFVAVSKSRAEGEAAEVDRQTNLREQWEDAWMPKRRALGTRWKIAARARARITQARRHNCEQALVVELIARHAEPFAQTIAAAVLPRDARFVRRLAGSLTDEQNARFGMRGQEWFRTEWKVSRADGAAASFIKDAQKSIHGVTPMIC